MIYYNLLTMTDDEDNGEYSPGKIPDEEEEENNELLIPNDEEENADQVVEITKDYIVYEDNDFFSQFESSMLMLPYIELKFPIKD